MSGTVSPPNTFFSILGLLPLQVNFRITLPTPIKLTWDLDWDCGQSTDEVVKNGHLNNNKQQQGLSLIDYGNTKYNMATSESL